MGRCYVLWFPFCVFCAMHIPPNRLLKRTLLRPLDPRPPGPQTTNDVTW